MVPSGSVQDLSYPFKDVFFMNEEKGFLAGGISWLHMSFNDLIRTEDGCNTFDFLIGRQGGNWMSTFCHFISDSVGFSQNGTLMKTSDGGESWIRADTLYYGKEVADICFINNSTAYAITQDGSSWRDCGNEIYQTTNGAKSWNKVYTIGDEYEQLYSIFFIDENTGWLAGWFGFDFTNHDIDGRPKLQKYSEEQGWREIPIEANLPLTKIYFVDPDHGWILGGYSNSWEHHPLLLKSEDGGENWNEVKGMDYFINDIYFETALHGWSVGGDSIGRGVILETFDGGENWEVAIDSLSGSLHALHMQNGHGWAVGDNGLVLKTEYTPTIEVGLDDPIEEMDEVLFTNYPNPFHFKTVISYQLPETGDVELSIYDLSGRKVITLINETQQIGNYEVEWSANGMNPAIYLCELKTGQGRQVTKIIKL